MPPDGVRELVAGDRDIAAVAGASLAVTLLDGKLTVPGLAVLPITGELWSTLVAGTLPASDDEVLVAQVLDALDARIGDTVELRPPYFTPVGAQTRIEGTAVFPRSTFPVRTPPGWTMAWP